ncbi:MAG TPA: hypothetical protein VFZ10_03270 [Geminicoccaceae bacterium]
MLYETARFHSRRLRRLFASYVNIHLNSLVQRSDRRILLLIVAFCGFFDLRQQCHGMRFTCEIRNYCLPVEGYSPLLAVRDRCRPSHDHLLGYAIPGVIADGKAISAGHFESVDAGPLAVSQA